MIVLLFATQTGFGQENVYQFADKIPLFNGATEENNGLKIKTYFENCGIKVLEDEKTLYIGLSFVIDSVGTVTSHKLLFGNDSIMLKKIVNCMENTPKWIPAIKDGKNVSCWFNLAFEK